jgi:hypothetical protein
VTEFAGGPGRLVTVGAGPLSLNRLYLPWKSTATLEFNLDTGWSIGAGGSFLVGVMYLHPPRAFKGKG